MILFPSLLWASSIYAFSYGITSMQAGLIENSEKTVDLKEKSASLVESDKLSQKLSKFFDE